MLTIALLLSGPHRQAMLETAFNSIPIESPAVSEVLVRHQGGPWNWGGALRERILAEPKVRLLEFPDKVPFTQSFNRTLDAVRTPWAMLLPDDDFLVRSAAKAGFELAAQDAHIQSCGLIAFGWYYLKHGRYLESRRPRSTLASLLHSTPKCCSTMLSMDKVRKLGGFADLGGFIDTELFGRLAYEFDAAFASIPVGVYRMHGGQESAQLQSMFVPYLQPVAQSLGRYARSVRERREFERALHEIAFPVRPPHAQLLGELSHQLRSRARPATFASPPIRIRKWLAT